ncbi:MAG: VanZ family protein [Bacteroidia bacterium]|nr:VanZ family protein [Bacteroidia bacterium]
MKRRVAYWALLISWMVFIFVMSQMAGEESSEQSRFVVWLFGALGLDLDGWFGEMTMWVVRKAAHTFEYFMLFILAHNVVHIYLKSWWRLAISLGVVFLYACTDEWHQTFVDGRAGCWEDVLIDTNGGIIGMVFLLAWYWVKKRIWVR